MRDKGSARKWLLQHLYDLLAVVYLVIFVMFVVVFHRWILSLKFWELLVFAILVASLGWGIWGIPEHKYLIKKGQANKRLQRQG